MRPGLEVFFLSKATDKALLCPPRHPAWLWLVLSVQPSCPQGYGESVHLPSLTPPASPASLCTPKSGAPWPQLELKVIGIPRPCSPHYFQSRVSSFYRPHKTWLVVT